MNVYLRFSRIAPKFGLSVATCFFFPVITLAQANPQPHPRDAAPEPILKSAVRLDPAALLRQARAKILESTAKLPKYTCVQSVRRSRFEPPARIRGNPCNRLEPNAPQNALRLMLAWTDRFKLDVTVSDGVEIFSWAGAREFQSPDPQEIVSEGLTGTGDFGPFLMDIFGDDSANYQFLGWESVQGRSYAAYRYEVPSSASRYQVKVGADSVKLAYEGKFWIDPRDAELHRMTIIAPRPPRKSDTCRSETEIQYQRIPIGGTPVLMPQTTLLQLWDTDGVRYENRVEYGACREFQSESVFRPDGESSPGDATPAAAPSPGPAQKARSLPPGIILRIAFRSTVDSTTSFAGDPIEGQLVDAVPALDGTVLAPEGAIVRGRIVRVEERFMPSQFVTIGLKFQTLVAGGVEIPVKLSLAPRSREGAVNGPDERRKGIGVFLSRSDRLVIGRHIVSEWTTGRPPD